MNVTDLESAVSFYDWFLSELGYTVYQKWDGGQSWRSGLNHLAFHASSKDRVDEMRKKLEERGTPILYDSPEPGEYHPYALYFEGPERLKLEYVWQGPPSEA